MKVQYWIRVPKRFGSWEFGNSDDIYIYNANLNQWEYQNAGVDRSRSLGLWHVVFAGFSIFYRQRRNFRTLKAQPGLQTRGTRCSSGFFGREPGSRTSKKLNALESGSDFEAWIPRRVFSFQLILGTSALDSQVRFERKFQTTIG
ncbi:unnamed protein product [Rhizophagus irregularis]|nr:unnamed protein product [Rhizophagus irregularis]